MYCNFTFNKAYFYLFVVTKWKLKLKNMEWEKDVFLLIFEKTFTRGLK